MSAESLTVPNLITLFRLGLVPVFVVVLMRGHFAWATGIFALAMVSDALDGLLARLLDQRTKLGGVLDPIADKLFVLSALLLLSMGGSIPWWLLGCVLFRDGMMVLGAVVVRLKNLEIPTQPTRIGKYATFTLTCTAVLALVNLSAPSTKLAAYVAVVGFVAGLCVVVSTLQYFARFGYLFFVPSRSTPFAGDEKGRRVG